jgi:hypothetical protein
MGRSRLQTVERGTSRPSTNKRVCGVFRKYSSVELALETTDLDRPGQVPSLSVLHFQLFVPAVQLKLSVGNRGGSFTTSSQH